MNKNFVELQVDFPGKEYARMEFIASTGRLTLKEVVYPDTYLPADLCSIPNTCTEEISILPALLIRKIALAPGCRVPARPIGLCLVTNGNFKQSIPLFVPLGDGAFEKISCLEDLPEEDQTNIDNFLRSSENGHSDLLIQSSENAWDVILTALREYRVQQTKQRKNIPSTPAWQAVSSSVMHRISGESERYTGPEYGYWQLPRRFQKYIEEYLQPNERILASLFRPSMRSALKREFLIGKRLQESIFIVTDRQVTLVEEKIPPSQSDVNYGYIATCCVPERLVSIEVTSLSPEVIGLRLSIQVSGGIQYITHEFPASFAGEIKRIAGLLSSWLTMPVDTRLRRASLVGIPEKLPLLSDPSCNEPDEMEEISQRFEHVFATFLSADEAILDWCLLPAWLPEGEGPRVLAITPYRLILLSDNDSSHLILDIPHYQIGSMELSSTYMDAHLSLFILQEHQTRAETIRFSKTLAAMERCFHLLKQTIAISPISEAG